MALHRLRGRWQQTRDRAGAGCTARVDRAVPWRRQTRRCRFRCGSAQQQQQKHSRAGTGLKQSNSVEAAKVCQRRYATGGFYAVWRQLRLGGPRVPSTNCNVSSLGVSPVSGCVRALAATSAPAGHPRGVLCPSGARPGLLRAVVKTPVRYCNRRPTHLE